MGKVTQEVDKEVMLCEVADKFGLEYDDLSVDQYMYREGDGEFLLVTDGKGWFNRDIKVRTRIAYVEITNATNLTSDPVFIIHAASEFHSDVVNSLSQMLAEEYDMNVRVVRDFVIKI